MTTGKTIALTIWAFVSKVMSLLFNMLSRFVNQDLKRGSNRVSEETYLCLIVEEKSNFRYRILGIPNTFPCPCYTHIHRGPSFYKYRKVKNHSFNSYSLNIFYYYYLCALSCPALYNPVDCNLPVSFFHGIFQARILEWVATFYCRGLSQPKDHTCISWISRVSCIGR